MSADNPYDCIDHRVLYLGETRRFCNACGMNQWSNLHEWIEGTRVMEYSQGHLIRAATLGPPDMERETILNAVVTRQVTLTQAEIEVLLDKTLVVDREGAENRRLHTIHQKLLKQYYSFDGTPGPVDAVQSTTQSANEPEKPAGRRMNLKRRKGSDQV